MHGSALGEEEIRNTKKNLGWEHEAFSIPKEIYSEWDASKQGQLAEDAWNEVFQDYESKNPDLAKEFLRR